MKTPSPRFGLVLIALLLFANIESSCALPSPLPAYEEQRSLTHKAIRLPGQSRLTTFRQNLLGPSKKDLRKQEDFLKEERRKEYNYLIDVATLQGPQMMSKADKKRLAELHNEFTTAELGKESLYDVIKVLPADAPITLALNDPDGGIPAVSSTYGSEASARREKFEALKDKATIKGKLNSWERKKLRKLGEELRSPTSHKHNLYDKLSVRLHGDEPIHTTKAQLLDQLT